jgi:hypothetical protein
MSLETNPLQHSAPAPTLFIFSEDVFIFFELTIAILYN